MQTIICNKGVAVDAREKNISKLYKARTAYIKWVNQVKLLVSGVEIDKNVITPLLEDTEVGRWFYNEAMLYAQFSSCQKVVEEMESLLESIFDNYSQIYSIYFGEQQNSGIKGLLKLKARLNQHQVLLVSKYYEDIVKLSDQLKIKFKILDRQLLALPSERHELIRSFEDKFEELAKHHVEIVESEKLSGETYSYGPRSH